MSICRVEATLTLTTLASPLANLGLEPNVRNMLGVLTRPECDCGNGKRPE